jgi:molybdopterin molybdotransferase
VALLSVADALALVLAEAQPLPSVEAPLADAVGRVLTADLAASRTQPPARIFTGAVMPAGTDTVVIQEITSRDGDTSSPST